MRRLRVSTTTAFVRPRPISWRTVPLLTPDGFSVRVFLPVTLIVLSSLSIAHSVSVPSDGRMIASPRHMLSFAAAWLPVRAMCRVIVSVPAPPCAAVSIALKQLCALHYTLTGLPCKRCSMDKRVLRPMQTPFPASTNGLNAGISGSSMPLDQASRAWSILRTPSCGGVREHETRRCALPDRDRLVDLRSAPVMNCPALRAMFIMPSTGLRQQPIDERRRDPASPSPPPSGRGRRASSPPPCRPSSRSAVTQQPRPGSLRFRSGTTVPSGPATKRISSSG